jgi:hypothetical protein
MAGRWWCIAKSRGLDVIKLRNPGHIYCFDLALTISPMSISAPFVAENERVPGCTHVLLITTGSVASVKAPLIVEELLRVRRIAANSSVLSMGHAF